MITLDRTWAKRLGVIRSSGVYRISSRDLVRRLGEHDPRLAAGPDDVFEELPLGRCA
jgi:hypothetical protein